MATMHPDLYAAIHNYKLAVEHAARLITEYHAALLTVERRATEVANILHKVECPHQDQKVPTRYMCTCCQKPFDVTNPESLVEVEYMCPDCWSAKIKSVDEHYGTSSTDRAWCGRCGWHGYVYQLTQSHSGPVCPKCGAYVHDIDHHVIRVPPEHVKYPCESRPGFPPQAAKS